MPSPPRLSLVMLPYMRAALHNGVTPIFLLIPSNFGLAEALSTYQVDFLASRPAMVVRRFFCPLNGDWPNILPRIGVKPLTGLLLIQSCLFPWFKERQRSCSKNCSHILSGCVWWSQMGYVLCFSCLAVVELLHELLGFRVPSDHLSTAIVMEL